MVKTIKRVVGFKTFVDAQANAKKNKVKHPRYGYSKKHKHFYEH